MCPMVLLSGFAIWKFTCGSNLEVNNQACMFNLNKLGKGVSQYLVITKKLGNKRYIEGLRNFKSSDGTNLRVLLILAGDIKINIGPRHCCGFCKTYGNASENGSNEKIVKSAFTYHALKLMRTNC